MNDEFSKPQFNRERNVQECDARMFIVELLPGT